MQFHVHKPWTCADMARWEDYLKTICYDPTQPAAFAGPQKLYKVVKHEEKFNIGMHRIRKFLQESYSLDKPVRRRFQRNHVVSAGKDDLWMADLVIIPEYKPQAIISLLESALKPSVLK